MWARIDNGAVAEITDINPQGRFHPSMEWATCDESVDIGDEYKNGSFYKQDLAPPQLRKAEISSRLNFIDQETTRPLRAVYAGTDTPEDHAKLADLENEANQLREELKNAN